MNYRKHSKAPYSIVTVHGGPGAPGEMGYVAEKLSERRGVIEPFQTSLTISGQIEELHLITNEACSPPVVMIGHSWGAWLAFMLAAEFPGDVSTLILAGASAFEESKSVTETRLSRLNGGEKVEVRSIMSLMNSAPLGKVGLSVFRRFTELISKADSFDPLEVKEDILDFQPEVYQSIWPEAEKLRRDGSLLKVGEKIQCPVIAIHGDYDPHPAEGVRAPLKRVLKDFTFILLKDCGHYPWREKKASKDFFEILKTALETGAMYP